MGAGKEYVCLMRLHEKVEEDRLKEALSMFTGDIYQVPPVRSAISRKLRIRTVYRVDLIEVEGKDVLLKIACSGGTYIRKYCYDIGLFLGVGAHMQELRRIRVGPFSEKESFTLHEVYRAFKVLNEGGDEKDVRKVVKPVEYALSSLPKVYMLDSAVGSICNGADLAVTGIAKLSEGIRRGDLVTMLTLKGEIVALGKALMTSEDMMEKESGIAVDVERVIMEKGLYPSIWKGKKHKLGYY